MSDESKRETVLMWFYAVVFTLVLVFGSPLQQAEPAGSLPSFELTRTIDINDRLYTVSMADYGTGLLIAYDTVPTVVEYEPFAEDESSRRIELPSAPIYGAVLDPTGRTAAILVRETLYLWSLSDYSVLEIPPDGIYGPFSFGFSRSGNLLYIASGDSLTTTIWDVRDSSVVRTINAAGDLIVFNADDSVIGIVETFTGRITMAETLNPDAEPVGVRPAQARDPETGRGNERIWSADFQGACQLAYVVSDISRFSTEVRRVRCDADTGNFESEQLMLDLGPKIPVFARHHVYIDGSEVFSYDLRTGESMVLNGIPEAVSPDGSYWIDRSAESWTIHSLLGDSVAELATDCLDCSVLISDNGNSLVFWDESTIEVWRTAEAG